MKKALVSCSLWLALALPLAAATPPSPKKGTDLVVVLVDTNGAAMVRWMLPEGPLPKNGFRLERSVDKGPRQVLATLKPGEIAATGAREDVVNVIREYVTLSSDPGAASDPEKKRRLEIASFAVQILSVGDPEAARLLGVSFVDRTAPARATAVYTVVALDWNGKDESVYGVSQPTPLVPMPRPAPPADLRAKAAREGALLFWNPSPRDEGKPWESVTYEVLRRDAPGGAATSVSERPVLLGKIDGPEGERAAFHDPQAPRETKLFYSVAAMDLLGRKGAESPAVDIGLGQGHAHHTSARRSILAALGGL